MLQPIELEEPFTADKVEMSNPFLAASSPQPSKPKRRKRDVSVHCLSHDYVHLYIRYTGGGGGGGIG
jgi:hypothetical protein